MPHPITTTVTLAAAVTTGLATAQSLPGAASLTLNGSLVTSGVGQLVAARRVIITSAGNDAALTWTIVGTGGSWLGDRVITETLSGANGVAVQSTQDFLTVTSISSSGATASTVTAGTNGVGSGPWVVWSQYPADFQVEYAAWVLAGSPTYDIEYTIDDPFGTWLPSGISFARPILYAPTAALTASQSGNLTGMVARATRLTLTAIGSVQLTQMQQGA